MPSKNNQSSAGQVPKNRGPTPEGIAKTRMPGKIELKQRNEKKKAGDS